MTVATTRTPLRFHSNLTGNPLLQVFDWLNKDHYVVLYAKYDNKTARCFHKCLGDIKTPEQVDEFLACNKVVYYDVACDSKVLNDGQWERRIKDQGYLTEEGGFSVQNFKECTCSLKERMSFINNAIPKDLPDASDLRLHMIRRS
jgi:hypothetical protein